MNNIKKYNKSIEGDNDIIQMVLKLNITDAISFLKKDYIHNETKRSLIGVILNKNKKMTKNQYFFFAKFIFLNDLHKIDDIENLNQEFRIFIADRFTRISSFSKIFNISLTNNHRKYTIKELLNTSDCPTFYEDMIKKTDYISFFEEDQAIKNINNLTSNTFVELTFDYLKIKENRSEIFSIYFEQLFKTGKTTQFDSISKIQEVIKRLNFEDLFNQIDISNLNKSDFSFYEIIISHFTNAISPTYLKYLYTKKISFYENEKIIIDHLCSINHDDLIYKPYFVQSIEDKWFKDDTIFIDDYDNETMDDILILLYKNGYNINKIINWTILNHFNVDPFSYLNENIEDFTITDFFSYMQYEDYIEFNLYLLKHPVDIQDFMDVLKSQLECFITPDGRLNKNYTEIIDINYKI